MTSKYQNVFKPIKINQMILKNRVVATSGISAGSILAGEQASMGGASMVCSCMVDIACDKSYFYANKEYYFSKGIYEKSQRDLVKSQIKRIHQGGAKYAIELNHVGEYHRPGADDFAWGVVEKTSDRGYPVKAIDREEMENIKNGYVKTSLDAFEMGFDAVMFDCAGGWLMTQFISPHYNKRQDEYGGSLENRARYPLEVVKAMRDAVGPHQPIICQITADEFFEDGTSLEDMIEFSKMIEKYVDCLFVVCGIDQNHSQMVKMISTNLESHMPIIDYTEKFSEALNIPVVLLGAVMSPEEAEYAISEGKADMVGLSRPLIADPDFVFKAMSDRAEDIVPCIRCNQCFHIATDYKNVGCSVNPYYTQQENQYLTPVQEADEKRKVVVVGAGPAGIRAALAADQCGHEVCLIEKNAEIGGLLQVISQEHYKEDIKRYLDYLKIQVEKSNISVLSEMEATPALIKELNPDKLIIAIGTDEIVPPIDGADLPHVFTAVQAIEQADQLGQHIAIIGGGTVGVELALGLAEQEHKDITIIEMTNKINGNSNHLYDVALKDRIEVCDSIKILYQSVCKRITESAVEIEDNEGVLHALDADSVIIATGSKPKTEMAYALFGLVDDTVMIGSVNKQGNIIEATYEGHASGVNIK